MKTPLLTHIDPANYRTIQFYGGDTFTVSFRRKTGTKKLEAQYAATDITKALAHYHSLIMEKGCLKYLYRSSDITNPFMECLYKFKGESNLDDIPLEFRTRIAKVKDGTGMRNYDLKVSRLPSMVVDLMQQQNWSTLGLPDHGPRSILVQMLLSHFFSLTDEGKNILLNRAKESFMRMKNESEEMERLNSKMELM